MKVRKILTLAIVCMVLLGLLAACGGKTSASGSGAMVQDLGKLGLDKDLKFKETRHITVEVYNRGNDGGTAPEDNFYAKFIKEGMLRDHNIDVTFKPVARWTEVQELNNLLAAGNAPDICVTYDYSTIQTYANMGGVLDLSSYIDGYKSILPNLWGFLGETNLYWDKSPVDGKIWAIEARLFNNSRINTFIREDWLKKLNLKAPTTIQEFEKVLVAFKDNAKLLLGADADKMIPFSISFDVGWRADHLLTSFVPDSLSDRDAYVYGFDDRKFLLPGIKEGVRKLNEWYNAGLIWKDFAIYGAGDATEDNMMKSGYVGVFMHNWDYPYRGGENGIQASMKKLVGPDAAYIAIEPFKNNAGVYRKFLAGPVDRKVFFPATNKEPVASMLYLDWITKFENRSFLQIGEEGVTHVKQPDGAVKTIAAVGEKIMNSPNNIDYTITINGLDLGETEKTVKSLALGYAGVDARYIEAAYAATRHDARIAKKVSVGEITSEEGMGPALSDKRNVVLDQSIIKPVSEFDATFDSGMKDYLSSGGQAIIDERAKKYSEFYK